MVDKGHAKHSAMKATVLVSDLQIPFHHKKATKAFLQFVKDFQPDKVWCCGDEGDQPEPSRWTKGMAGEYAPTLQAGLDQVHEFMAELRANAGADTKIIVQRSNHTDRIQKYIDRFAPALASLRSLDYPTLVGYPELGIEFARRPTYLAPGWIGLHGDEGAYSSISGMTALKLARKHGRSVACGHTHSLALVHDHATLNGSKTSERFGFELGNLMDQRKAEYLPTGSADWQQGFGILYHHKTRSFPVPVPIIGNSFQVEGKLYEW